MLLCVMFGRRTYNTRKYFIVCLVVLSVSFFTYEDNPGTENAVHHAFGICLIALSLLTDGLQGAVQDRIRLLTKPLSMNNMFYVNGWSSCILTTILAGTGEGRSYIKFVRKHPSIALYTALAAVVGTGGQTCIAMMVANFGSLQLSLVATTRRMFTVFLSALIFGNDLTAMQWAATFLIFVTLLLDLIFCHDEKIETAESAARSENREVSSTRL